MTEEGQPLAPSARGTPAWVWLQEGARVLAWRAPRWAGLDARPATLLVLLAAHYLLCCALQYGVVDGSPDFYWTGLLGGWAGFVVLLWLTWVVARSGRPGARPLMAVLVGLLCGALLVVDVVSGAVHLALNASLSGSEEWLQKARWSAWGATMAWLGLAQLRLLWRVAGTGLARIAMLLLVPAQLALTQSLSPIIFWWASPEPEAESDTHAYRGLPLSDEVVHAQPQLLAQALGRLQPPEPGRVNLYALTYAPYASEDVFMRESAVVAKAMRERFGAGNRTVELVMNPATGMTLPWATPLNLREAIARTAAVMDRERDVLFLHLTSHGGADGKLASNTWPLETKPLTPQLLRQWLDEAGVRWRVVSVSACYSGSWIAPLAGDGTLVMTAADADHTSYGCGRRSPLTFFGQAMYVDALYGTRSFVEAHAQARQLIEVREKEAGKQDGYSNPQLNEGRGIGEVLQRLQAEQEKR